MKWIYEDTKAIFSSIVGIDSRRIMDIEAIENPGSIKILQSFWGMVNYLQYFILNLTDLKVAKTIASKYC